MQFHLRRFEYLANYFDLVADVSHWWINVLDEVFARFPECKAIGMVRDIELSTESFMRTKGYGRGTWNHWAPQGNSIWIPHPWDPTYPTYPFGDNCESPDRIKHRQIARYVQDYNTKLLSLAEDRSKRVLAVRTEDLSDPTTQRQIFSFAGVAGQTSAIRLNYASVKDGVNEKLRF